MTYQEACEYIAAVPRFTKKNRPQNTEELLRRLGHPEESFSVVHVAGTNGKGSVCAMLESIFRQAGMRTGLFTSPHLVDIRERFRICRRMVPEDEFLEAFSRVLAHVKDMQKEGFSHPAYFEFLFAMGMLIFRKEHVDVLVMETGLGGRLDATNCVKRPKLTVITSISFDHMQYLGHTISEIAAEKAGIIKKGVPVVADGFVRQAFDVGEAVRVTEKRAEMLSAPLTVTDDHMAADESCGADGIRFTMTSPRFDHVRVHIPFLAHYQVENCVTAMTAASIFGQLTGRVSLGDILQGIEKTRWPGRMEAVLPGVILDGAHNDDGISQFVQTARRFSKSRQLSLLFAAVSDKDYDGMIRELCSEPLFSRIYATQIEGPRMLPAKILADTFRRYTDVPVTALQPVSPAFREALSAKGDGILFCAGSLYLVGEIEALLKDVRAEVR